MEHQKQDNLLKCCNIWWKVEWEKLGEILRGKKVNGSSQRRPPPTTNVEHLLGLMIVDSF